VPIRTVHRARLLEGLVELVADQSRCHFTKRLATISQPGGGRGPCTLHFADGSTAEADVVLGADGVHSAVRKHVLGEDHPALRPQFTGAVVYRGVIPMERVVARLGEEVAQNTYCHFGPGVLTLAFPIEQGKLVNFVCIDVARGGEVGEQWMWPSKVDEIREKVKGFSDAVQGVVDVSLFDSIYPVLFPVLAEVLIYALPLPPASRSADLWC
jgi:salicylate hydroxylase